MPMPALRAALCIEPLHLTIAAAKGLLRVKKESEEYFQDIIPEVLKSGGVFMMRRDKMTKAFMFDRKYQMGLADRSDWATGRKKLPTNDETWYTDGSKGVEGTGAGIYHRKRGRGCTFPLERYTTVLQCELVRVLNCTLWTEAEGGERHLHISTDSRSAIEAVKAYTTTSSLVYDFYRTLKRLVKSRPLTIFWLQGHTGIKRNEIAGRLARQAKKEVLTGLEPATEICDTVINAETDR